MRACKGPLSPKILPHFRAADAGTVSGGNCEANSFQSKTTLLRDRAPKAIQVSHHPPESAHAADAAVPADDVVAAAAAGSDNAEGGPWVGNQKELALGLPVCQAGAAAAGDQGIRRLSRGLPL